MTIAITARLILNGSFLKEMIVRNDMDEIIIEVRPEIPTNKLDPPTYLFLPKLIHFKQAFYTENLFSAWGVPKQIEEALRAAEKEKQKEPIL